MAAANGFVTETPDTRWGADHISTTIDDPWAYRFTAPGSGSLEISEIGCYGTDSGEDFVMAIFEDDAANGCPGAMVANSGTTAITTTAGVVKLYHTYGTKPVITGGSVYWLAALYASNQSLSHDAGEAGTGVFIGSGVTYPTWPADDAWHTHTDRTESVSMYAVYAAEASGAKPAYAYAQQ